MKGLNHTAHMTLAYEKFTGTFSVAGHPGPSWWTSSWGVAALNSQPLSLLQSSALDFFECLASHLCPHDIARLHADINLSSKPSQSTEGSFCSLWLLVNSWCFTHSTMADSDKHPCPSWDISLGDFKPCLTHFSPDVVGVLLKIRDTLPLTL